MREEKAKQEGKRKKDIRKAEEEPLREVIVKIKLERIDIQEGITVEVLLDIEMIGLVMSSEFAKKTGI